MKKKSVFRGAATALITPFRDGKPDKAAFCSLIRAQCDAGIDALVVCGTTGEAATLTDREQSMLISWARENASPTIPIIAGCGSPSTVHAVKLAQNACKAGADALLCVTPYYNKCTEDGLYAHYTAIADASEVPLILYEVPARTGVKVLPQTYTRLAAHENIAAVKDAAGDLSHTAELLRLCGDTLDVYSGDDALTVPILSLGGAGVISVLSNLIPETVAAMCRAWFSADREKAAQIQLSHLPQIHALFSHVNPVPVKAVMAAKGLCREEYRLPLCPLSDGEKTQLLKVFGDI